MTDTEFSVTAAFDRTLFWQHGQSVRYLVVRLNAKRAAAKTARERAHLNIALAIDASGSMGGGKLEAAKQAAMGLVERMTADDRLSLVSFASDVQVHIDAVPVDAKNRATIVQQIDQLTTRGMTCLSGGWFAAVECAAAVAEANPKLTARVILLSDGQANEGITDRNELAEHAGELRQRGVFSSALGIGDGYDELLLRAIAENGGGRLHDAELASEISSVLLGEIDDIYETVLDGVELQVSVPQGARITMLGKGDGELREDRLFFQLGPVQHEIERTAIFRVICPKALPGEKLEFTVGASGTPQGSGTRLMVDSPAAILRPAVGVENTAQAPNATLVPLVARAWFAHVVTKAATMNRVRAYREAGRMIDKELKHFRLYVADIPDGPAMVAQLELLAQRAERELSPRLSKEMVLSSALMMEDRADHRGSDKANWMDRIRRGE